MVDSSMQGYALMFFGSKYLEKTFFWTGPLLAGFNVASHVLAFFSIGAVASWLRDEWFPFTRWVWDQIFFKLDLSQVPISDLEKDVLTTVVFFAPLGIWALIYREEDSRNQQYKVPGLISGVFFLVIVSRDFFGNASQFFVAQLSNLGFWWISIAFMCSLGLSIFGTAVKRLNTKGLDSVFDLRKLDDAAPLSGSKSVSSQEYNRLLREKDQITKTDAEELGFSSFQGSTTLGLIQRKRTTSNLWDFYNTFGVDGLRTLVSSNKLLVFTTFIAHLVISVFALSFVLFVGTVGLLANYCLILIALFCTVAIWFSPYRLYVTVGIVACFVLSGFIFDFIVLMSEWISSINTGSN